MPQAVETNVLSEKLSIINELRNILGQVQPKCSEERQNRLRIQALLTTLHNALCQVQLDYSSLRREHTAVSSSKERDKLNSQFQADMEERAALLAKVAPNLKAMEQYEAVKVCFNTCLPCIVMPGCSPRMALLFK